ncbi:MAG TPA: hypothetical protein VHQ86_06540 [Candidatus Saccharimonadia bacterium]|jgi:hypothetical protein|nr:hypothetical protein [Candidatus Saccharimonadia bacterium]
MDEPEQSKPKSSNGLTIALRWIVGLLVVAFVVAGIWVGHVYASEPQAFRQPQPTHYHFRLQILVDGKPVNFAGPKFQESEGTVCTEALTAEPMHFHDNLDQFVHIHWAGMTGGLLLKNYGWNLIGGPDDTLGYRFDKLPKISRVPIHSKALPSVPAGSNYYVYSSTIIDPDAYKQRTWNEFVKDDFTVFFSKQVPAKTSWLDRIIPAAYAHGDETELAALNDVLGNVVIFVQKTPPTADQIKARFEHLVPLPQSSCGG